MGNQNILYHQVEEAIIPASEGGIYYDDKDWVKTTIAITKDFLIYKNRESEGKIPLNNIYYMDRKVSHSKATGGTVLNFNYKQNNESYMGLIRTTRKEYLKRVILLSTISNIKIYYISPYQTGGKIHIDAGWNEGFFQVGKNKIMIRDKNGNIVNEIPERKIFGESKDKIKGYDAIKINYERDGKELADIMLSSEVSLAILGDFFSEVLMKKKGKSKKLSDEEKEIMMAIQTGINSSSEIAELMEMDHEKVLDAIDLLKEKGVINIIGREKIVELSSEGKQAMDGSGESM